MKVLLTFTGFHDPYGVGLVGDEEQAGTPRPRKGQYKILS